MSDFFANKFKLVLEEEIPALPGEIDAGDAGAAPVGPPEDVSPDDSTLDVASDVEPAPVGDVKKAETDRMKGELQEWITKIKEFNEFLNGTESDSLQKKLNSADCDTLFANISRSETKKIARVAQDLSGIIESLKGYVLSSDD